MKKNLCRVLILTIIFGTIGVSSWYSNNKTDKEIKQKENEIIELDRNLEVIRETINQFNDDLQQIDYKNNKDKVQIADSSNKDREEFEKQLKTQLNEFANIHNSRAIDWNDSKQQKWHIYYDHSKKEFTINDAYNYQCYNEVYFTSYFIAEQAKNTYEKDLIRYYTTNN